MMCDDTPISQCGMTNPKTFSAINGVDLRVRLNPPPACSFSTNTTVKAETSFYNTCVDWRNNLEAEADFHGGYGSLSWIGHIGFYVCKANSCHAVGKAMDLTKLKWAPVSFEACNGDHASSDRTLRRRYLAVDATCRRYFKWVLDGWYNSEHANHIHASSHFTTANAILDRNAVSDTVFVQAVCNNFNSAGLSIDGNWGTQTENAFDNLNAAWGYSVSNCNPFNSNAGYSDWLHRVIAAGFDDVSASNMPTIPDGCNR